MQTKTMPICYTPSTVVLLDDNEQFLVGLQKALGKTKAAYKAFHDSNEAYAYLEKTAVLPDLVARCTTQEIDPWRGKRNIELDIAPIAQQIYNAERFAQPAVLVIDQDMPGIKGLEICKKLVGSPIKKILLTGKVANAQVVEAFNDGLIDMFIPKSADDFDNIINPAVKEQLIAYWSTAMQSISNGLITPRPGYKPLCIQEPAFIEVVEKIIEENDICEYYLSDDSGSYIFLDSKGKPSWLVVKDADDIEQEYCSALEDETPPDPKILEEMKRGKIITHIFLKEEDAISADQWKARGLLFKAKTFTSKNETYYYAYINDPDAHDIERDKIESYQEYLKQVKA